MWKWRLGDFPGCPVGKTLCFHCRELRSQMLCIVAKKKKSWRQGMGLRCQKPRNMWGYQNLKGARKDSSLQAEKWVWSCHTSIQTSSLQNSETTHLHVSMSTHLCEFSWHFFFFISLHNMWDLSSLTRDWTCAPAAEVQSLNHWTSREVPYDTSSQQS